MQTSRRQFALGISSLGARLALGRNKLAAQQCLRARPIRTLIVDGVNNHDWRTATVKIKKILALHEAMFDVEVSTTPPRDAEAHAWDVWRPLFTECDVVIINWNGGDAISSLQWPNEVEHQFENYISSGGGMVSFHAANNAFTPWNAYNHMIGLGWRPASFGPGIRIGDDDRVVVIPEGMGHAPGHPPNRDFQIHVRQTGHPITKDMPRIWMHPMEQLTHGQHGPIEGLTFLTYANSPITRANEPMDWINHYGNGRVYVTMLGHNWMGEPSPNLDCVGFQTLFARGVQWAATGRVSIPLPVNFPGPDKPSFYRLT